MHVRLLIPIPDRIFRTGRLLQHADLEEAAVAIVVAEIICYLSERFVSSGVVDPNRTVARKEWLAFPISMAPFYVLNRHSLRNIIQHNRKILPFSFHRWHREDDIAPVVQDLPMFRIVLSLLSNKRPDRHSKLVSLVVIALVENVIILVAEVKRPALSHTPMEGLHALY
jgi:hypothetical protein